MGRGSIAICRPTVALMVLSLAVLCNARFLDWFNNDKEEPFPDSEDFEWGYDIYDGPYIWPEYYPSCGGDAQSPIDLPDLPSDMALPRQHFDLSWSWLESMRNLEILNNGHTVQVNIPEELLVDGGGLPAQYQAAQFHFHWGSSPDVGSEHTVDGSHAAMEMHIVTWDKTLGSFADAKSVEGGIAVLAFFIEVDKFNIFLQPIVHALTELTEPGFESTVSRVNLYDLVGASLDGEYFRYDGSLTTPTCDESVIWTIFREPITISYNQWQQFTELQGHDGPLVDNFRPVQPINGRDVELLGPA